MEKNFKFCPECGEICDATHSEIGEETVLLFELSPEFATAYYKNKKEDNKEFTIKRRFLTIEVNKA